jgi:hypothetical protein
MTHSGAGRRLQRKAQSMDRLTQLVAERAGIDPDQAAIAVATVLRALAGRLPSPLIGRIWSLLEDGDGAPPHAEP